MWQCHVSYSLTRKTSLAYIWVNRKQGRISVSRPPWPHSGVTCMGVTHKGPRSAPSQRQRRTATERQRTELSPREASIKGFCVRSGQSTTDTATSWKLSFRPCVRTKKKICTVYNHSGSFRGHYHFQFHCLSLVPKFLSLFSERPL